VDTDLYLSETLALLLNYQRKQDGSPVHTFIDRTCLVYAEPWEEGFLKGLRSSKVVLLICSDAALKKLEMADTQKDNMLLEVCSQSVINARPRNLIITLRFQWEFALELRRNKKVTVLPLLVGRYEGKAYHPFGNFSTDSYPNAKHSHPKSPAVDTVRDTMVQ